MQNQVSDQVIAITGAGSGIGKAIAIELAKYGAKVVLGSRTETSLTEATQLIKDAGGEVVQVVTDVKKKEDLLQLVDTAVNTYGRLDVMINNAGVAHISRIDELEVDQWDNMINSNLKGVLYGMAAAIPVFKQQQSGHIINIISTSGLKIV
ncbi:MAG: SDR family NAD(P)-dependent oxidoreductase, partial [Chitinophagaceae bacterium]